MPFLLGVLGASFIIIFIFYSSSLVAVCAVRVCVKFLENFFCFYWRAAFSFLAFCSPTVLCSADPLLCYCTVLLNETYYVDVCKINVRKLIVYCAHM